MTITPEELKEHRDHAEAGHEPKPKLVLKLIDQIDTLISERRIYKQAYDDLLASNARAHECAKREKVRADEAEKEIKRGMDSEASRLAWKIRAEKAEAIVARLREDLSVMVSVFRPRGGEPGADMHVETIAYN